jgi:hypothetical protein
MITPFDHSAWLDTCKAILLNVSLPNIVQQMNAALEAVQERMTDVLFQCMSTGTMLSSPARSGYAPL